MASNQAVQLWQQALRQLEALPTKAGSEPAAASSAALFPLLNALLSLQNISRAVWSRLVNDLKIPLKLGQAAASAPDPWAPKGHAALCALSVVVEQVATAFSASDSLTRSISQQLQRSGFTNALPRLLDDAATALTGSQQEPDLADVPQQITRTSSHTRMQLTAAARRVLSFQDGATWLLQLLGNLLCKWAEQTVDKAACAPPALRLCAAAVQHCCRCADALPADGPPPTALEQLMRTAFAAGSAVACTAQQKQEQGFCAAVLQSPDAVRAVCMLLMVPVLCPQQWFQEIPSLPADPTAMEAVINRHMTITASPDSVRHGASLAAWRSACTCERDVTQLQQQALQALECSSRALMFAAGHVLTPAVNSATTLGLSKVYLAQVCQLLEDSPDTSQLEQQEQVQQLAQSLSKLGAGNTPPGSSLSVGCCLWLVPAVLLEWAGRQPADAPHFALQHSRFGVMLCASAKLVLQQQEFWDRAEKAFCVAAWEQGVVQGGQQALLNALVSAGFGGGLMAPMAPLSQQTPSPEQARQAKAKKELYEAASKAAAELGSRCELPAFLLVQLLHLASNAAAAMLAGIRRTPAVLLLDGSSSASSGSSSASSSRHSSRRGSSAASSSRSSECVSDPDEAESMLGEALMSVSEAGLTLQQLASSCMWTATRRTAAARRQLLRAMEALTNSCGAPASDAGSEGIADDSSLTDEQQASLNSVSAALQQTLPQLTSLMEAAVRTGAGSTPQAVHAATTGCSFLGAFTCPAVFAAAGLTQGSSPALKPMCSLAVTLLKLLSATLSKPNLHQDKVQELVVALGAVSSFTSLVLQVACVNNDAAGSSSGTNSAASSGSGGSSSREGSTGMAGSHAGSSMDGSDRAVLRMLLTSEASTGADMWDMPSLSVIRRSAVTAASQSGNSGSSSSSSSSFAVEPWIVSLGRCSLVYALAVQHPSGTTPAEGPGSQNAWGRVLTQVGLMLFGWLQRGGVAAQVATASCIAGRLEELIQSARQVQRQGQRVGPSLRGQLLQGMGLAFSSVPVGTACNNPVCCVLEGPSELQLVVGRARLCAGCRVARYCCRACQTAHWKQHKPACKAVAAALAAESAAGGAS